MKPILTIFLAVVLSSCVKTIETVREVPVTVKEYVQRVDTLVQNTTDSVLIVEKGDTVRIERYRTQWRDRVRIERDSVPYVVEVTKTTIKEVPIEVPVRNWIWWIGAIGMVYGFVRLVLFVRQKVLHL